MGTHYAGNATEVRALSAYINLMRAADTLSGFAQEQLAEQGLTVSQFGVLEALYHCGTLCQGDLAGKVLRSMGSLTSVVSGLEKRGLARRERSEGDKRFVNVSLTAAGKRQVERVLPGHVTAITKRFAAITPEQQEYLRRLCRQLGKGYG